MENDLSPVSLTRAYSRNGSADRTTIVSSFNWNLQIKIGYVPRVIIFRSVILYFHN